MIQFLASSEKTLNELLCWLKCEHSESGEGFYCNHEVITRRIRLDTFTVAFATGGWLGLWCTHPRQLVHPSTYLRFVLSFGARASALNLPRRQLSSCGHLRPTSSRFSALRGLQNRSGVHWGLRHPKGFHQVRGHQFDSSRVMWHNSSLQPTAKPLRGLVPSALRAPAAADLRR